MDTGTLISKLNKQISGAVIEQGRFGRTDQACVWIESRYLKKVADFLKRDSGAELDWLENLSAMQMDEAIVISYFLRSKKTDSKLVLRHSLVPPTPGTKVETASVRDVWPMAQAMEAEIQDLFGVFFEPAPRNQPDGKLPSKWSGYPLRKSYSFPKQVEGIVHSRPAGRGGNSES